MPKIVKTDAQEAALKDVTEKLKVVAAINPLFDGELGTVKVRIENASFPVPFSVIGPSIRDYRKKLVADILAKSKANAIALDESDMQALGAGNKEA